MPQLAIGVLASGNNYLLVPLFVQNCELSVHYFAFSEFGVNVTDLFLILIEWKLKTATCWLQCGIGIIICSAFAVLVDF